MNYARIENNKALEVFRVPEGFNLADCMHPDVAKLFTKVPDNVTAGSLFNSGTWDIYEPPIELPPNPLTWASAAPEYFWIDVGPFFDRFGAKALAITRSEDADVRGLVTLLLPRKYIDLKRSDLPQLVGILQAKGLITVAELAAALNQVTTDYERHVKGLPQPADDEAAA
ncbi:hypothetical protein FHW83_005899 [Duganella sp. SG902]|uniref:hypothetical protein n=1 Tax=Duganella sp. SG902 TaxID=2587016 RepID=UPI00159D8EF3|nr:hypothetical protein [Duganella sp. SG902]NVM80054.1 hypothetical protein [Duganella sp. SG902]